jgi:hypothetical protein
MLARITTKGNKGNTITPVAVAADAAGNVYLAQVCGTIHLIRSSDQPMLATIADLRLRHFQ